MGDYIGGNNNADKANDDEGHSSKPKSIPLVNPKAQNEKRKRTNTDLSSYLLLQNEQQAIGWDNFLRGKMTDKWRESQRRYELQQRYERKQRNVRLKLKIGKVSNPYDDD